MSDESPAPPITIGFLSGFGILRNRDGSVILRATCGEQQSITIIQEELAQLAQILGICGKVPAYSEDEEAE